MTNSHSIKITMSSPEEIGKAIQKQDVYKRQASYLSSTDFHSILLTKYSSYALFDDYAVHVVFPYHLLALIFFISFRCV